MNVKQVHEILNVSVLASTIESDRISLDDEKEFSDMHEVNTDINKGSSFEIKRRIQFSKIPKRWKH